MNTKRAFAYGLSTTLVLAILAPLGYERGKDSFPLSSYPMFAKRRGTQQFAQVVGVTADGKSTPVPPAWVASDEVLQTKVTIAQAAARGKKALSKLCDKVATRASLEHADFTAIEIARVKFDPLAYFDTGPQPLSRKLLQRCSLPNKKQQQP